MVTVQQYDNYGPPPGMNGQYEAHPGANWGGAPGAAGYPQNNHGGHVYVNQHANNPLGDIDINKRTVVRRFLDMWKYALLSCSQVQSYAERKFEEKDAAAANNPNWKQNNPQW